MMKAAQRSTPDVTHPNPFTQPSLKRWRNDRMKKLFLLIVVIATVLSMFGCAQQAAPSANQGASTAKKTFADMVLCYPQLGAESDWRTANTASMKEEATVKKIKQLVFSDAQQKQENQISAVR